MCIRLIHGLCVLRAVLFGTKQQTPGAHTNAHDTHDTHTQIFVDSRLMARRGNYRSTNLPFFRLSVFHMFHRLTIVIYT